MQILTQLRIAYPSQRSAILRTLQSSCEPKGKQHLWNLFYMLEIVIPAVSDLFIKFVCVEHYFWLFIDLHIDYLLIICVIICFD